MQCSFHQKSLQLCKVFQSLCLITRILECTHYLIEPLFATSSTKCSVQATFPNPPHRIRRRLVSRIQCSDICLQTMQQYLKKIYVYSTHLKCIEIGVVRVRREISNNCSELVQIVLNYARVRDVPEIWRIFKIPCYYQMGRQTPKFVAPEFLEARTRLYTSI
jgi:hypothetical protein